MKAHGQIGWKINGNCVANWQTSLAMLKKGYTKETFAERSEITIVLLLNILQSILLFFFVSSFLGSSVLPAFPADFFAVARNFLISILKLA